MQDMTQQHLGLLLYRITHARCSDKIYTQLRVNRKILPDTPTADDLHNALGNE